MATIKPPKMSKKTKKKKQQATAGIASKTVDNSKTKGNFWLYLVPALLLAFIVFSQTFGFDFVNWDDDLNVLENRGVLFFDLKQIWTSTVIGNYNPLPITTFAFEHALVGLDAKLYHVNNFLLHLLNVGLVYALGRRLKLEALPAAILAILFAIHPMRVESVAWITERKDVLFSAFYFAALLVYERKRQQGSSSSFSLAVIALFALALVSKIQAVSLPLSMICLDYLRQGKLDFKEMLAKAPYFAMSLIVGLAGIYFLGQDGSLDDATNYTFFDRLAVGAYAFSVYLVKSIVPYQMSPLYPYPSKLPWQAYASFIVMLAAAASVFVAFKRQAIAWAFGITFFTVNVVFMLQVLGAGQGYLADRFTYVGYFGLFWLFAYGIQFMLSRKQHLKLPLQAGLAVYLLALVAISYSQTKIWANGDTLWSHVSELYPKASTAHGNRAQYLRDQGKLEQAMVLFGKAIDADPNKGAYLNSRGKLHFDQGRTQEAIQDYSLGITREPSLAELYVNRGAAYGKLGNNEQALLDLNKGLELEPDNFNGYLNRSLLYYLTGRYQESVADYNVLLKMKPERDDLWEQRGAIRAMYGEIDEAIRDTEEAIRRSTDVTKREAYQGALDQLRQQR